LAARPSRHLTQRADAGWDAGQAVIERVWPAPCEALAVGPGAPSGTVTFLFTDIEGSTRLWQEAPEAMRRALERHDAVVRAAIDGHGGYVFSTGGDGFGVAFARSGDALAAAAEAQAELAMEAWPKDADIRVRMGLHTGEVSERDGNYFGTPVNQAARLMAVGHGGQVLCSQVTASLVGAEVRLVDLGEHRLRDLSAPMRVFQVGGGTFAPLRSLDVLPGNLPSLASSFVGRELELTAVVTELGAQRFVTLTGVGGVGKTRLALQVAAEVLPGFRDGAWVCELAAAATDADLAQVVAISLGVVQRQQMTMLESIVDFLRPRGLLVVLDNYEHLLDAAAALVEMILAEAPGVRILATSQEGLGIPGEHLWPLRSLSVPAVSLGRDRATRWRCSPSGPGR
jgi:class 3 adenylate cyclase